MLAKQRLQEYIGTFDRRFMMPVDKALIISIGILKRTGPLLYRTNTYE